MDTRIDYQNMLRKYVEDNLSLPVTVTHKRVIHKFLRKLDDSNLYPIYGRFNATNRAINRYNRECRKYNMELCDSVYSYVITIQTIISDIVNGAI